MTANVQQQPIDLELVSLDTFGKDKIAKKVSGYEGKTAYINKDTLAEKVTKASGYIIREKGTEEPYGFVLLSGKQITDMFTFTIGRDKLVFQRICHALRGADIWDGNFNTDENAANMLQWFVKFNTGTKAHEGDSYTFAK